MFVFTDSGHLTHWIFVYFLATVKSFLIVCWPNCLALPESLQEAYYSGASASYSKTVALTSWNTLPEYYIMNILAVVVLQLLSHILLFMTPWTAAYQASMSFTISQGLLKLMSIELMMPSNHLNFCLLLPSIFPSIGVFSNELALHIRWPMYWSFSFSISPSNNIQDWFPLGLTGLISLLSKGLLRIFSAPQFESINSSVLSLLYGPTLMSIPDCWKHHSFDYMYLCCQSNASTFLICCLGLS